MTNAAEMQIVVELKDKASASLKNVNRSFSSTAAGITKGVAKMAAGFALLMGAAAIGGTILVLKKSISAFTDFEDAMASVAKTTGLSGEALAELSDEIKKLSKTIPVAAVELADISAIAGQLGIQGTDNILAFTETVSQISVAFDMAAEQAATAMAKLGNIYDIPIEQTSNLASAINVLGNTTAASESQLSAFGMSLGAASKNLGFTATESMALGATLISMGMDASDAGTRLNSAFTKMATNIDKVSEFLGMSEDAFRDAFGKAPVDMVIKVVRELNKIEDPLLRAETASKMFGIVGAKAITGLGGNLDGLITNLESSAQGFEENTSLAEEFAAKTNTLKAAMQLLKNNLNAVAITIGAKLAPYVRVLVDKFIDFLPILEKTAANIWRDLEPALKKLWDKFKDIYPTIKEVGSELIDRLKPAFEDLKSAWDSIIRIASNLISGFTESETAAGSLTSVVDIAIDTFNWFAKAISTVLGFLAEHPKVAAVVVGAVLLMVAPILKIIAIMIILATAWDQNWFGIKDTTLRVVDIIVDYLKWSFQKIQDFWSKHGDTIMAVVNYMWTGIKTTIEIVISTISLIINVFLDVLEGDWSSAWNRIKEYTSKTFSRLVTLFESWKSNILPIFIGVWDSFKEKVAGWADDTWSKIKTWVSDVIQKFIDFKDSIIATVKGWYDTIVGFFDFSDIQVKWPDIPNPFEGIDWCGSIPDWVKNALGICGGTTPSAPGYEKYNVYQEPDLPPYERAAAPAPHSKYSKHDKSHSEYDVWTQHDKSGHEKWQRVHMADGGPVNKDLDARLHEGEYVVPKAGTLVMGGSPQKDGHVQMTYNIGTVNGVDGLEKLLEKHDRELYRRLVSLV